MNSIVGKKMQEAFQECLAWYSRQGNGCASSAVCPSRDVFQGRLDHMHKELAPQLNQEAETALLVAIAGEIGNNCFDHNLGQWCDIAGCWFHYGVEKNQTWLLLADRGQGVLASLKRILVTLDNDQQALETAFSKKLSGRSPERRGNGLKFVRSIINGNSHRGLLFISGKGCVALGGLADTLQGLYKKTNWDTGRGTFACVFWKDTQ